MPQPTWTSKQPWFEDQRWGEALHDWRLATVAVMDKGRGDLLTKYAFDPATASVYQIRATIWTMLTELAENAATSNAGGWHGRWYGR